MDSFPLTRRRFLTFVCIHIYIIMCVHMQADVFEALDLASEFDKVGRGKFKNSQGLCHHGLYIACALSFALTRHDGVLVPENGMEDPGFGRPFGIPGHDQAFLQAADGCVPCCRDHMAEAPGHPGAGAANEPGSQIALAETMQQVSVLPCQDPGIPPQCHLYVRPGFLELP